MCVCGCVARMLKVYCFSKLQVQNTVLLSRVTVLYIRLPELIHPVTEDLLPFPRISTFAQPLSPC